MAEIVFAAGVPHAPALVGLLERAPDDARQVVIETFRSVSRELRQAKPDVVITFANDHISNSRIRSYPDFLIGLADEHVGPHEWFKPWIGCRDYAIRGNAAVGEALFTGMTRRGIRMTAQRQNLRFDDNLSVPVVLMDLDSSGTTLVPVLQNCTVPPFPDGPRCYAIGEAIADFIRSDLPAGTRVALLGSGGLSHEPGGARYYKIDEEFDRGFLDVCVSGDHQRLIEEFTVDRMERAGIGGTSELLSWYLVMAAIGECPGRSFGYTGWTGFRCGVGGVIWDLPATRN